MRSRLPRPDAYSAFSSLCELIQPAEIDEIASNHREGSSKRSQAMYLINPAPSSVAKTRTPRFLGVPDDAAEERLALVPGTRRVRDAKQEVNRDLLQARHNFSTIFHASPAILCIIQLSGLRYVEINRAYERSTGYSRSEVVGKVSLKLGLWSNAEDRKRMVQKLLANGCLRGHQEVFQTKSGEALTTFLSAEIIEYGGELCALVVAEDITMRQEAEEARMDLAQRLINAQEAECTRVARELHDHIGQSLALFTMELERMRLNLTGISADNEAKLGRLCGKLKDLGRVVGNLSHQLHSSELELLGLAVAVRALCREFSEHYFVKAELRCSGVPDNLPAEVSLCLFRVMQEAMHNVAKHSQASKIDVEMNGTPHSLHLSISDNGVGFTPKAPNAKPGLGLTSMRERLHLIGGKFTIVSKPGSGTRIEATVPLAKANLATVFLRPRPSASIPANLSKNTYRPELPA